MLIPFFLLNCTEKKNIKLSVERFYIVKSDHIIVNDECIFKIYGYCEVSNELNYKIYLLSNNNKYFLKEEILPDSLKEMIIKTITNTLPDTAYFYHFEEGVESEYFAKDKEYDFYFIIENPDGKNITIGFYPIFLPDSLSVIYENLYESKIENFVAADTIFMSDSLHYIFENAMLNNMRMRSSGVPPPPTKSTIKFSPEP